MDGLQRFETLFEKNAVDNGGSFYIRSKIFFAKEHLMQDWPAELNVSKFDNEGGAAEGEQPPEEEKGQAEADKAQDGGKTAAKEEKASSSDKDDNH